MPHAAIGRALMLAAALALAGAASAQKMYRWVDGKGVTHFSENPPPDGAKAVTIEPKVTPPSGPAKGAGPDAWRERDLEFRRRQIDRGEREKQEARVQAQRRQACMRARERLDYYADGRIYRDNPDGSRTWMSETERAAALERQRELARENCD